MFNTDFREVTDANAATSPDFARTEPSHIHIPRPSRLRQSAVTHCDDEAPVPAQLELALEEAA